jgi:two-component system chemotaxis sensor kinase CheA
MAKKEDDFLKRLLATFKLEAEEHIKNMLSGLIELEKAPPPDGRVQITEAVFREAHSLKGAARSVNILEIEGICQALESVFSALKSQEMAVTADLLDVLYRAFDNLTALLPSIEGVRTADERSKAAAIVKALKAVLKSESGGVKPGVNAQESEGGEPAAEDQQATAETKPLVAETIRISNRRLESLLLQTEELISVKQAATRMLAELDGLKTSLAEWKGDWNHSHFKMFQDRLAGLVQSAERDRHNLDLAVDGLLGDMRRASMLPLSSLLEIFPKFVRDLARDQDKDVELVMRGQEIEIDRRILEEMKDAFMHLARNCIDHGIEKPEERTHKGKSPRGTVTVTVSQNKSGRVDITVSDDGAGIDLARVRETALRRGLISQEEADRLDEPAVLRLIYRSGVSTSPIITNISGRGLGLAIVQEKVERLGGTISLVTHRDRGTTFSMSLPLNLATFRGLVVRAGEGIFVIPTMSVERVGRVKREDVKTVENRQTIPLDGQVLSLVRLAEALEVASEDSTADSANTLPVVVVTSADNRLAFAVEEILDEQEVLVKTLGRQLSRVRNIVGASLLATGKVVPVLNVQDLMKSAVKAPAAPVRVSAAKKVAARPKSILVVEDSITARSLLKNILEVAGYAIKTAIDGIDAFTALKTGDFDLVVSDVDMPRMSGFDLTAAIRADKKLSEMPIVLVTALESREHRERGVEVGANAYIVKSSFDQSDLLETIKRLI